jgi:hypothetical protein
MNQKGTKITKGKSKQNVEETTAWTALSRYNPVCVTKNAIAVHTGFPLVFFVS